MENIAGEPISTFHQQHAEEHNITDVEEWLQRPMPAGPEFSEATTKKVVAAGFDSMDMFEGLCAPVRERFLYFLSSDEQQHLAETLSSWEAPLYFHVRALKRGVPVVMGYDEISLLRLARDVVQGDRKVDDLKAALQFSGHPEVRTAQRFVSDISVVPLGVNPRLRIKHRPNGDRFLLYSTEEMRTARARWIALCAVSVSRDSPETGW